MDSVENPSPSRLICPAIRTKNLNNEIRNHIDESYYYHIVNNSYYFSNAEDDEFLRSHHLLPLIGCNNKETTQVVSIDYKGEVGCGACWHIQIGTTYYFCNECDKWYHKECVESPPMLKSPYHPKHSLQLYKHDSSVITQLECHYCRSNHAGLFYHCSICKFFLDPVCVRKPPLIHHGKRHEHTLYFFPRKSTLICDVCGLDDNKLFIFICLRCDFVVHRNCIYLPHVIKISRHKHRISFVYSLSSREWFCGICRQKIDETYGAYSCMMKDCIYGVHSKCATKSNVWDGKELEGEPDEVEESIKPSFEEITDGIIIHFSHSQHPMQLNEDVKILYDEKKHCQACILPLYDGKAYTCTRMECDYVLHEACAYLPRVKQHVLHAHSLTLDPCCTQTRRSCGACLRESFGFKYVCYIYGCESFSLDVRCASIPEPYVYHSHLHPLFLTDSKEWGICPICGEFWTSASTTLNCDKCSFVLCFGCATLPYKVRYKNDEHLLTFSYEQDTVGIFWCDLCEETIATKAGLYKCNECEVTLHIKCLLGTDLFMNPSSRITVRGKDFNIVQNSGTLTRPICNGCERRCQYKMMFVSATSGDIFCSITDICKYESEVTRVSKNQTSEAKLSHLNNRRGVKCLLNKRDMF